MPQVASSRDIQRNYTKVRAKAKKAPVVIMKNNQPDLALSDWDILGRLQKLEEEVKVLRRQRIEWELRDAMEAIKSSEEAEKNGTLIHANSLADLIE